MAQYEKHFTVAEARQLLPRMRRLFQELHDQRDALRIWAPRHQAARQSSDGNGGGTPGAVAYLEASGRFQQILREFASLGVQIKDIDSGLVDFPHIMNGEEVFLCWRLGEDTVSFWHHLDSGVASRSLLPS